MSTITAGRLSAPHLVALAVLVTLTACATPDVGPSGFLGSYHELRASDETGAVRVSVSSADVLGRYTTIMIDEPAMVEARLSDSEALAIRNALAAALQSELARDRQIVTSPSADTLRVRYAIVEVETSNVALNALTTAVFGAVDYGSLALEAEVVDALTGERVASMTWARGAKATNVLGAYSPTGNARALAPDFAQRLAMLISPHAPAP
jgi:hypothetical protein